MGITTDGLSYWQAESEGREACHHRLRRCVLWRTSNDSNEFRWPGGWDRLSDPSLLARPAGRRSAASGEGEGPGGTIAVGESRAVAEDGTGAQAGEEYRPGPASARTGQ